MSNVNNSKNTGNGIKCTSSGHYKFYFVHPHENADSCRIAEQLMGIKNVEEVLVTDGDYGFIVKTRFQSDGRDEVYSYISKNIGSSVSEATSYYHYKK